MIVTLNISSVASVYPTMKSATNPYMFSVGGTNITGTSGQNIDDLLRNTRSVFCRRGLYLGMSRVDTVKVTG